MQPVPNISLQNPLDREAEAAFAKVVAGMKRAALIEILAPEKIYYELLTERVTHGNRSHTDKVGSANQS